jgi:hypothetical protein
LKLAVNKRSSYLTTSVTNLNVVRVTGMMRDTHQYALEDGRRTEHVSRDPSIHLYGMVLFKHTNNFPLITACDGISEFENNLRNWIETEEV